MNAILLATLVVLTNSFGTARIDTRGARVVSYVPTGGVELFAAHPSCGGMSPSWPWYEHEGPNGARFPGHGLLRGREFAVAAKAETPTASEVTLAFASDELTRREFPHDFTVTVTVRLGAALEVEMAAVNVGTAPFEVTEAFQAHLLRGARDRFREGGTGEFRLREPAASARSATGDQPPFVCSENGTFARTRAYTLGPGERHALVRLFRPRIDRSPDRVESPLAVDMRRLGTLVPKSTAEIAAPSWTLGCETLDRDFASFDAYKAYLPPLGIKRIRLQAGWAKCERERGRFDFAWLDGIVGFCATNGIEVLMDLSYGNPIYPGGGGWDLAAGIPNSEEGLAAWDRWTEAIARHFGDRVAWWAMWNEPDIGEGNTPERVAAFNVRTAKTLRRVLPKCRIAGLSLAHNTPDWMESCLKPMGAETRLFDAFIYHGYQLAPEASYARVAKLKEVLARHAPHAFLWQCENGAPSEMCGRFALAFTPWSELTQAKWDLRRMLGDRGHDVASSVFTICDFNHRGREMNRKGLLRANEDHEVIAVKRAYYAVQNLVSVFDGTERRVGKPRASTTDTTLVLDEYETADGAPLLAFWSFAEEGEKDAVRQDGGETNRMVRPMDSCATRPAVFRWNGPAFEEPVWVDLLTGRVHAFPRKDMLVHSRGVEFVNVPVYDSPALLTERKALRIR